MISEQLKDAIIAYMKREFDEDADEFDDSKEFYDMAYTLANEEQPDGSILYERHEIQVTLKPASLAVVYYIDGKEVWRDVSNDTDDLTETVLCMDFDSYVSRALDFAPDNYTC